ncbi:unnamed protein product [Meganyctiphanes norvegica]|uniref:Uncharacterized protein n=1 Tax=Meganyctiphanes norvegica TaxID=48144 RepID=A0AAV2S282_MEGNR
MGQLKIFGGQRPPRIMCGLHYNLTTRLNLFIIPLLIYIQLQQVGDSSQNFPSRCFLPIGKNEYCAALRPQWFFISPKGPPMYMWQPFGLPFSINLPLKMEGRETGICECGALKS